MLMRLRTALFHFLAPPTTPADAMVVAKFYDHIPDPTTRNTSDILYLDHKLGTIEVPTFKVSIKGADGTPSIQVPVTLFNKVEVGEHVEVRTRPSRFFANTTRVSFAF